MLQSLHNTASSFFIKLLLGLLVASFALWGIGDVFRSGSPNTVVSVGDSGVTAQEFSQAMQEEMMEYRQMLGARYSGELLKTLGVPQQVLAKLVERKLVEEEARSLGVIIPDSYVKSQLRNNPSFYNQDGKFDAEMFRLILRNNGLTEGMYIALLEKEATADVLLESALTGVRVTDSAARTAYLYSNESREADVLVFTPDLVKQVAEPDNVELEAYYEKHAESFTAPEHRIFSMVALDAARLTEALEIGDDELQAEYQHRIGDFEQPEKREVKQLLFADEATAEKAAAALENGMTLEKAAKEFETVNDTLSLGMVTAAGILPEAEDAVFALKKGEYSAPVQSSFGWHIFQVTAIEPAHTRPLSEVKDELTLALRNDRAGEEIYELSNTLQDDLAGGASIEDAAKGVGATAKTYGPVSKDGHAPDGTEVKLPQGYGELLDTVFALGEGDVSTLMETEDGSYYAVRVDSVQPKRTRALDEIRGQVVREWKQEKKEASLYELASGIAGELKHNDVANVAGKTGAVLHRGVTFRRDTAAIAGKREVPAMFVSALFAAQEGASTDAYPLEDGSYVVAKLGSIHQADADSAEGRQQIDRIRDNLRVLYGDEFYQLYMTYLRKKHGVSEPNMAVIDAVIQ